MNSVPSWLGLVGVHQDWLWFTVLLGWSFAVLVWWRAPRRATVWRWLPWAATAGIATALLQFFVFSPPFDLFYERLVPGTNGFYVPAVVDPDWAGDVGLAVVLAGVMVAWGWREATRRGWRVVRWWIAGAGVALVKLHVASPAWGGGAIAAAAVVVGMGAAGRWRWTEANAGDGARAKSLPPTSARGGSEAVWSRAALGLTALTPLVSTIGPLAAWAGAWQRNGPTGWVGAVFAAAHLVCLAVVAGGFAAGARALETTQARALWRDARPFVAGGFVWLALGALFALRTGYDNAWEVKTNRLRTAASRAAVMDRARVERVMNAPWKITGVDANKRADGTRRAEVQGLTRADVAPLARQLAEIVRSTPFLEWARFVVLREGWLVAVTTNRAADAGEVTLLRRATDEDEADWAAKRDVIEELPVPEERRPYYCRAAVVGADGRMLGWLEFVRQEFYSSMERKWRTGPLLVTALGAVLAGVFFVQRRSSREREEALRAAAVAAEAARVKTAFLAKVSHELRTPLQSILGYSELLQRELPGEAGRQQLAALQHHGRLMTRLVNDLIDLSALESGAFRLIEEPVRIGELVQQTVESLRPRAAAKGLALTFTTGEALPAWVSVDGERLRQILLNLLGNAVKFTERGRIDVSLGRAVDEHGCAWLELAVADTGPGIAAEDQKRLFQFFSRLELTAKQEGSGLGLALVAGLCRSMGGDVSVTSELGEGACFRVKLPLRETRAPRASSTPPLFANLRGKRVLVADDNALVRELFATYLGELGATCALASDGEEAWQRARSEPCDAVILDLAMPRLDGREVARRLRAAGSRVRIVGVSAHTDAADRNEALAAGMDEFLTKPVELGALQTALAGGGAVRGGRATEAALGGRLRELFRAELPGKLEELARLHAARAWSDVAPRAHWLKNSAAVLRDDELFAAADALERAAAAENADAAAQAWAACERSVAAWKA